MLHNPHIGLTKTLEKLYEKGKIMADCVVPQEYGSSMAEKRSIGSKMCRALLEKIKYDLLVAKTDDKIDMRYLINMEHGTDLPINTMGRRVRTRLYFTSESHLHTMLNVLRCGPREGSRGLLSVKGRRICNKAPELCYLTQIVFRLFEDTTREVSDPKRFRIEVMFCPGATATPMHMAEMDRDSDSSRFDTDKLYTVGRNGLTIDEVEAFFNAVIEEGTTEEEADDLEVASKSTNLDGKKKKQQKPSSGTAPVPTTPKRDDRPSSLAVPKTPQTKTGE